jgi:starch-binding outer membrane protein, SusD/RagB family
MTEIQPTNRRGRHGRWLAALLLFIPFAACDLSGLLDVDAPGQIPASRLEQPEYAGLLVNGAVADFECAIGAFVLVGGLIADEFADAQLGSAAWWYDRRDANLAPGSAYGVNSCDANQTPGIYRPLSTARWAADNVLRNLQQWTDAQVPNRQALIARSALYSGFSLASLGMTMCSAALDAGPEMSKQQLFAEAEDRFTTALDAAIGLGDAALANAARVGRARVRLFQGNATGAAADASAVPLHFAFYATASAENNRRYNRVFASNRLFGFYTIEPHSRGLTTGGVEDPRTQVHDSGFLAADGTSLWVQNKYVEYGSPIPMARGAEARLILAEILGGQEAVNIINELRDLHGLPHFQSTDQAEIMAEVIEERRKELWMEGHRFYDIHRFDVPLVPEPGTPFVRGGTYGTTTCLPLPDIERFNNPNID